MIRPSPTSPADPIPRRSSDRWPPVHTPPRPCLPWRQNLTPPDGPKARGAHHLRVLNQPRSGPPGAPGRHAAANPLPPVIGRLSSACSRPGVSVLESTCCSNLPGCCQGGVQQPRARALEAGCPRQERGEQSWVRADFRSSWRDRRRWQRSAVLREPNASQRCWHCSRQPRPRGGPVTRADGDSRNSPCNPPLSPL
jgi:hypothetical protein